MTRASLTRHMTRPRTLTTAALIALGVFTGMLIAPQIRPARAQQAVASGDIGPYQLFQGTYTINHQGSPHPVNVILRIDTDSSATWVYQPDGLYDGEWERVSQ